MFYILNLNKFNVMFLYFNLGDTGYFHSMNFTYLIKSITSFQYKEVKVTIASRINIQMI